MLARFALFWIPGLILVFEPWKIIACASLLSVFYGVGATGFTRQLKIAPPVQVSLKPRRKKIWFKDSIVVRAVDRQLAFGASLNDSQKRFIAGNLAKLFEQQRG